MGYHVKLGEHAKHIVYDITKDKKKQKDGSTKLCWVSIPIFLFEPDQVEPQKKRIRLLNKRTKEVAHSGLFFYTKIFC